MLDYNSNPSDIVAVIGPSISDCCYQVSEDLYNKFKDRFKDSRDTYLIKENQYYLNLQNINKYSLESCGVKSEYIFDMNICTSCNSDKYHSYRMHDKTQKRIGMLVEIL